MRLDWSCDYRQVENCVLFKSIAGRGILTPENFCLVIESIKLKKSLITAFFIEPNRGAWDAHPLDHHGRFHAMVPQSLRQLLQTVPGTLHV